MTLNAELIALLVHDLRNPLAALMSNLGYVSTAVRDDEMTSEAVLDCVLSSEVLQRLIENVAAIGMLEGADEPPQGACSVSDVLAAVQRRMSRHAETSMFRLSSSCAADVGRARITSQHLALALDNLIALSMAYAPSSSLVEVVARRIDESTVGIVVLDEGDPVDPSMVDAIVNKESQGAVKSAKGGRYGRAFGVYVVRLIAESAGGTLHIGEQGGRAAFELRLPSAG